jgi:hypothetical protein
MTMGIFLIGAFAHKIQIPLDFHLQLFKVLYNKGQTSILHCFLNKFNLYKLAYGISVLFSIRFSTAVTAVVTTQVLSIRIVEFHLNSSHS